MARPILYSQSGCILLHHNRRLKSRQRFLFLFFFFLSFFFFPVPFLFSLFLFFLCFISAFVRFLYFYPFFHCLTVFCCFFFFYCPYFFFFLFYIRYYLFRSFCWSFSVFFLRLFSRLVIMIFSFTRINSYWAFCFLSVIAWHVFIFLVHFLSFTLLSPNGQGCFKYKNSLISRFSYADYGKYFYLVGSRPVHALVYLKLCDRLIFTIIFLSFLYGLP